MNIYLLHVHKFYSLLYSTYLYILHTILYIIHMHIYNTIYYIQHYTRTYILFVQYMTLINMCIWRTFTDTRSHTYHRLNEMKTRRYLCKVMIKRFVCDNIIRGCCDCKLLYCRRAMYLNLMPA